MLTGMSTSFTIKQGDTGPALQVTLRDSTGTAVDITGNLGVQFEMKERQYAGDGAVAKTVDAAATVVSEAGGIVKYQWVAGDTADVGEYVGEFAVTASDGTLRTFPSPGFITIRVVQDL